jgi:hypothetical protein
VTEQGGAERPLPRSFDVIVVVLAVQSHLAALFTVLRFAADFRSLAGTLALLGCSLAVPLGCLAVTRVRGGGDLPLPAFVAAGVALLALDVASAVLTYPDRIGAPSFWATTAVGVTLLALSPFRPPRDIVLLAVVHTAVVAAVLAVNAGRPAVRPFTVLSSLAAAFVLAVASAEFVRYFVRAVRRRQDAVAEQARAQAQVLAAAAITEDAGRRLARLRTEVLPLLADVAAGRRPVDDPDGARLAQRLSADLRRELVEARSGAWLLEAPVPLLDDVDAVGGRAAGGDESWPRVVLLDPERLVGRLAGPDRAALGGVLAALRAVGGWAAVSVALSTAYLDLTVEDRAVEDRAVAEGGAAFVTVVARAVAARSHVDERVRAAASRAGCTVGLEVGGSCVVEGRLALAASARLKV